MSTYRVVKKCFYFLKLMAVCGCFQMKYLTIYIKTFIYHEATSELFLAKRKSNSKVCAASQLSRDGKKSRNTTGGPGQHAAMENNACKFDEARKVKKEQNLQLIVLRTFMRTQKSSLLYIQQEDSGVVFASLILQSKLDFFNEIWAFSQVI